MDNCVTIFMVIFPAYFLLARILTNSLLVIRMNVLINMVTSVSASVAVAIAIAVSVSASVAVSVAVASVAVELTVAVAVAAAAAPVVIVSLVIPRVTHTPYLGTISVTRKDEHFENTGHVEIHIEEGECMYFKAICNKHSYAEIETPEQKLSCALYHCRRTVIERLIARR